MLQTMPPSPFLSQILDASAAGYAVLATERLLTRRPEIADRFAPHPRLAWKENLSGRLRDLSDAVEQGRPGLFVDQVVWGKIAFAARGVPTDDLLESLVALREVLDEELPPDQRASPLALIDSAIDAYRAAPTDQPSRLSADTDEGRLAARYVLALLEGDRRRASAIVLDAVDAKTLSVRDAYLLVLIPAQIELGRMWHMNEISVAEEHFVTATTKMVMAQLLARSPVAPRNGRTIVVSAVEGDTHDIGLHVAADFLEIAGWRVIFLGNNMPPGDLVRAIDDFEADILALSATLPSQRRNVAQTIKLLRTHADRAGIPVLVGGRAFADDTAWRDVGADACAPKADDAVSVAESLVNGRKPA
jgi:methanogenic corrinoid protein MtbC1